MKLLLSTLVIVVSLAWGCTPADQVTPPAEATPAASTGDEITEMDFESGEVEQPAAEREEPAPEPTPDVP